MSDDVYILGAGASVESGAPLMNNFLDVAEDLLRQGAFDTDGDKINLVFDLISELQIVHSKAQLDINNIESLFGAIEMGIILGRMTEKSSTVGKYKEALMSLISKTLVKSMAFPFVMKPGVTNIPAFSSSKSYNLFVDLIAEMNVLNSSVLTFNYDLGMDLALAFKNLKIDYGLRNKDAGFKLLKLHGSINWYTNGNDSKKEIKYLSIEDTSRYVQQIYYLRNYKPGVDYTFDINNYLNLHGANESQDLELVIVPPTWNKTEYHGQLANVWGVAADELSKAKNIYILGYSLPESDSFFRYLFALGTISKSRVRNIIVYNPDSTGETEARFRRLLGLSTKSRFQYKPLKFSESIMDIAESKKIKLNSKGPSISWV